MSFLLRTRKKKRTRKKNWALGEEEGGIGIEIIVVKPQEVQGTEEKPREIVLHQWMEEGSEPCSKSSSLGKQGLSKELPHPQAIPRRFNTGFHCLFYSFISGTKVRLQEWIP